LPKSHIWCAKVTPMLTKFGSNQFENDFLCQKTKARPPIVKLGEWSGVGEKSCLSVELLAVTADGDVAVNLVDKTGAMKSAPRPTAMYTGRRHPTVISLLHAQQPTHDDDDESISNSARRSSLVQSSTSTTFSLITLITLLRLLPR